MTALLQIELLPENSPVRNSLRGLIYIILDTKQRLLVLVPYTYVLFRNKEVEGQSIPQSTLLKKTDRYIIICLWYSDNLIRDKTGGRYHV